MNFYEEAPVFGSCPPIRKRESLMQDSEPHILIVDDDSLLAEYWKTLLEGYDYERVTVCIDSREVESLFEREDFDVVLLDLHLPYISGQSLLIKLHEEHPDIPIIIITAEEKVDTAVECMKAGAFDFMTKPILENRLIPIVQHALQIRELQKKVSILEKQTISWDLNHPEVFEGIISGSDVMYTIFGYLEAIATSPKAVLVTGESGTGKELIARAIHRLSRRSGKFVTVNVSGLDDAMFSDTLFGHTKGAFTGAESVRKGLIEQAAEGTLFLDEIGDLDVASQVKLLRLLQEEEFYPLGSDRPEKCRARIIAATNADLKVKQQEGTFRKDLYYRLMAHHIEIPPLRDRIEDIPLLVRHFIREAAMQLGKEEPKIPKDLMSVLAGYSFPGNIRELQAMIFDAVSRNETSLLPTGFFKDYFARQKTPSEPGGKGKSSDFPRFTLDSFPTLQEIDDFYIREALRLCNDNQSTAARLLGISQSTLSRWKQNNEARQH